MHRAVVKWYHFERLAAEMQQQGELLAVDFAVQFLATPIPCLPAPPARLDAGADRRRSSRGRLPLTPYLVDGRLAPSTINRILAAISTLYEYLVLTEQAGIGDNPLGTGGDYRRAGIPTRPVRRGMRLRRVTRVPRPLTDAQVAGLLDAITSKRDRAILLLMLQAFVREIF